MSCICVYQSAKDNKDSLINQNKKSQKNGWAQPDFVCQNRVSGAWRRCKWDPFDDWRKSWSEIMRGKFFRVLPAQPKFSKTNRVEPAQPEFSKLTMYTYIYIYICTCVHS